MSGHIELRDGPALPTAAISLALELESRGYTFSVSQDRLILSGGDGLSAEDRKEIKRWRLHLMALVDYGRKGVEPR